MADTTRWYAVLQAEYRRSFGERLAHLTELARRRDASHGSEMVRRELLIAVHNLRGTSGSYGLERVSAIAADWEAALEREASGTASHPTPDDAFLSALGDAASALPAESTSKTPASRAPISELGRILVVDDDADMRAFLARLLIADGQRVEEACSAEAALARLDKFRPELIIADVSMPGIDGYALCREVRGRGYADIPFFFCTVLGSDPLRIEGLRCGADDYLVKPVDPEELLLRVRNQLSRLRRQRKRRTAPDLLRGRLDEVDPATLLQMFAVRGSGARRITLERAEEQGELYLDEGGLRHAVLGRFTGAKALFRMLEWRHGHFRLEKGAWDGEQSLGGGLDSWLLEGMRQIDESRRLRERLGAVTFRLAAEPPGGMIANELEPLLPALRAGCRLSGLLDASPQTDLELLRMIDQLVTLRTIRMDGEPD